MAISKKYDVAVKVGEYQSEGKTKARYLNVGSVMENDEGGRFLMLDRTFNPAGVPNPDGRPNVILSFFEPKDSNSRGGGGGGTNTGGTGGSKQQSTQNFDDDIPF